jgi:hypothetical protein
MVSQTQHNSTNHGVAEYFARLIMTLDMVIQAQQNSHQPMDWLGGVCPNLT